MQIYSGSSSQIPVHTSWWLSLNVVVVGDFINNGWGPPAYVSNPPFPLAVGKPFFFRLTVNTSTTVDVSFFYISFFTVEKVKFGGSRFLSIKTGSIESPGVDVHSLCPDYQTKEVVG